MASDVQLVQSVSKAGPCSLNELSRPGKERLERPKDPGRTERTPNNRMHQGLLQGPSTAFRSTTQSYHPRSPGKLRMV